MKKILISGIILVVLISLYVYDLKRLRCPEEYEGREEAMAALNKFIIGTEGSNADIEKAVRDFNEKNKCEMSWQAEGGIYTYGSSAEEIEAAQDYYSSVEFENLIQEQVGNVLKDKLENTGR